MSPDKVARILPLLARAQALAAATPQWAHRMAERRLANGGKL